MRLFSKASDGGTNSGVTGFFLIEWKPVFSIVILRFAKGTREAYHSHAFNAVTLWLWGSVREHHLGDPDDYKIFGTGDLKLTPRNAFHKIDAIETTWALSIRGPWADYWQEDRNGQRVTLTHGRKELN